MSDEKPSLDAIEVDCGLPNGILRFSTPDELLKWNDREFIFWEKNIYDDGYPYLQEIRKTHQILYKKISDGAKEWDNRIQDGYTPQDIRQFCSSWAADIQSFVLRNHFPLSTSTNASFLIELKKKTDNTVAVGAFCALTQQILLKNDVEPQIIAGMFEAFLYQKGIDWSAKAQLESLDTLRTQYLDQINTLQERQKAIETKNTEMSSRFGNELKKGKESLQKLLTDKTNELNAMANSHKTEMKNVEKTYDQKLALQKPVEYWKEKEIHHAKLSKYFGFTTLATAIVIAIAYGFLVHWAFGNLSSTENPKHWQIAILLVVAFFAVWLLRILIRLFFSHQHLATDAAERKTMILTYIAMSREGGEFTHDDKKLILQHLFRAASDGIVKDDAAPASVLEFFTRGGGK